LGCSSCRACQKLDKFECIIDDDAKPVLAKMARVDVIVVATPFYFFSASALGKSLAYAKSSLSHIVSACP